MTKPTKWLCAQRRLRSAWASAQSDQSLCCLHEESLGPMLPIKCTAKTLIRLGRRPGWFDSSLSAHSLCWFCHVAAHVTVCVCECYVFVSGIPKYEMERNWASSWWNLSHRWPAKASLFAHMTYGSRWRVWPKIRNLAPLDGCACLFEEWVYGGWNVP